jgi:anti-sigma regulatory factor (Ser/Thr protein kinase)
MTGACASGPSPFAHRNAALDLAPLPCAVPCARLHVRCVLREWNLPGIADDAELVVSELVTNAIRAAAGICGPAGSPPVRLRLTARPRGVQIEVWDASRDMPSPGPSDPGDGLGGRGLVIVAALATRHGAYATDGGGKCVFAVIERRAPDRGADD